MTGDDAVDAGWFGPDDLPEIAFRTHRAVLRQWRQARAVVYRPATLADADRPSHTGQTACRRPRLRRACVRQPRTAPSDHATRPC